MKSKKAELWELGQGTWRTQIIVYNLPVVVHSMLDPDLKNGVNPFKTWPWSSSQSRVFVPRKANPPPTSQLSQAPCLYCFDLKAFRGKNARLVSFNRTFCSWPQSLENSIPGHNHLKILFLATIIWKFCSCSQ